MDDRLRRLLSRLEHEAALWREEPLRRVAARNRLLRPWRVRQFQRFGLASIVDRPVWLYGAHKMDIGDAVVVLRGCWLAVERPAWGSVGPVLRIGDRSCMRFGCTISAAESVTIENDVGMGAQVTVIDSRHSWAPSSRHALHGPLVSAPVRIGQGTWIADRAAVVAGADIGEQCAIGANSLISGTVPDYSIVVGNPPRIVGSTRA